MNNSYQNFWTDPEVLFWNGSNQSDHRSKHIVECRWATAKFWFWKIGKIWNCDHQWNSLFKYFLFWITQVTTLEIKTGSHTHVCKITLKLLLFSPWQNGVDFLSIAIKLMTAFSLSAKAHYNFLLNKEGKKWKTRRMDGDHQYTIGPNNFWIQIEIFMPFKLQHFLGLQ